MSGKLRQAARKLADSTVAAAQPFRWAVQVKTTTNRQTTGLVEVERVGAGAAFWAQVRNSVYLAAGDLVWVVKDPSAQGNWIFDGFVKGAGTGESLNNSPIPSVQTPIVTSPDGTPLIIRPIAGQQGTIGRINETIIFAGAINVTQGITFASLGAGIVQSSAAGVLSSDYTIDATTTWASGTNILPVDAAGQDLGDATHRWDLFGAVADISVENAAAGGGNSLQAFIYQTDGTGMTGTLRGAYLTASGGNTANTGTIRGAEIKARAGRPGETGNDVAVLEGFSVSSDAKTYDVTVHRGGEIILDGGAGTSTLAVGLRIANNFQADRATTSYGLQIYRDSFDYTADIQLSHGHTIVDSTNAITLTGLIITPSANSISTLDVNQSDGTAVLDVDTTNRRVVVTSGTTGQSTIEAGLIINNASGGGAINDTQINSDTLTAILVDASADTMVFGAPIVDKIMFTQADGNEYIDSLADGYMDYYATTGHRFNNWVRHTAANYRRYYHLSVGGFDPGASGATWTDPDANHTGGWQLNAAGEILIAGTDIHADWDGASDITAEIYFALNAAGNNGDTVDLKVVAYYNGVGDTATKTQTVEVATVTDGTQFKVYKAEFTIDYDAVDNVVDAGDNITFILNLETDTSEIDDIIVLHGGFYYNTTHLGIESGDV